MSSTAANLIRAYLLIHGLRGLAPPGNRRMAMNNEFREAEMSIEELDHVSGGDMLGMAIDAAEKAMTGLFGRLIEAVHKKA
jgi:hypothetical protein